MTPSQMRIGRAGATQDRWPLPHLQWPAQAWVNQMKRSAAKKMKQRSAGKPDIELGKRIRLRRVEQKISQAESATSWASASSRSRSTRRA